MATARELVDCVAETLGFPRGAVVEIDRSLAEGGKRSRGGRGLKGPKVTPRDAANLIIATAASFLTGPKTMHGLDIYKTFAELPMSGERSHGNVGLPKLQSLGSGHVFAEALERLIMDAMSGDLHRALTAHEKNFSPLQRPPVVRITFAAPDPYASIEVRLNKQALRFGYRQQISSSVYTDPHRTRPGDLTQVRQITFQTLLAVGKLLARESVEIEPSVPIP
jgi:hypothetical protein